MGVFDGTGTLNVNAASSDYDLFFGPGYNEGPAIWPPDSTSAKLPPIPQLKPPQIGGKALVIEAGTDRNGNGNVVPVASVGGFGLSLPLLLGIGGAALLAFSLLRR